MQPTKKQDKDVPTKTAGTTSYKQRIALTMSILLLVAVCGAVYVFYIKQTRTTTVAPSPAKSSTAVVTNVWTGKANTYDWATAANWSRGLPTDGQNLEIDVSKVTQPSSQYGHTSFAFQNNLPNLTINKLIIHGQVDGIIASIKGDPFTVTGGIEDTAKGTTSSSSPPQIQINCLIRVNGTVLIKTTNNSMLTFSNDDTTLDTAGKIVQFAAADTSSIDVDGAIRGNGTIQFATSAISRDSTVSFGSASPDFNGAVVIGKGDLVQLGNRDKNGGSGSVNGFGNGSITILDGGGLGVFAAGTSSFTISNKIAMSGNGVATPDGSLSGAISACLTNAEQGCDPTETVHLTGAVTLRGNTQIGQSSAGRAGPINTEVDYSFTNLHKNGYALKTSAGYHYVANF